MAEENYNDDWYVGYVETSVDPGPWMLVGTAVFCIFSLAMLPCLVSLGRRYEKRRLSATQEDEASQVASETPSSYVHGTSKSALAGNRLQGLVDKMVMPPYPDDAEGSNLGMTRQKARSEAAVSFNSAMSVISSVAASVSVLDAGCGFRNRQAGLRHYQRALRDRQFYTEQKAERKADEEDGVYTPLRYSTNDQGWKRTDDNVSVASQSVMSELEDTAVSPNDAVDARITVILSEKATMEGDNELDLCCGDHAWWRPFMIAGGFDRLIALAEWDREMKRILGLAIPFSMEAVSKGIFDTIRVALVAHFLGTEPVSAYTIVQLILGLTQEFFGGFPLAVAALGSQAVGAKNYKLAGEYVQISVVMFTLFFVPNIVVWMFLTDDVVKLFGFNDKTAQDAQSYARFFVFEQMVNGFLEAYGSLLGVIDHERFIVFMSIANELVATVIILAFLLTKTITVADVGLIQLISALLFFGLTVALSQWFGWMKKYSEGMFRTFALRVSVVTRVVIFVVTTDANCLILSLLRIEYSHCSHRFQHGASARSRSTP